MRIVTQTMEHARLWILLLGICCAAWIILSGSAPGWAAVQSESDPDYGAAEARKASKQAEHWITAEHSTFEVLQQDFASGPEVTKACLSCHNEAGEQVQNTIHWTWICPADPNEIMGKNGLTMNNF
nr:hypothetical protein [Desulfovermiculus halophilus]